MRWAQAALGAAMITTLDAAIEVQAEVGVSRSWIRDGNAVMVAGLQPALLWRLDAAVTPVLGGRAGPVVVYDPDAHASSAGIEARLLAGLGWLPANGPRVDVLGSWGGGRWRDNGITGVDGWGRILAVEATTTWALDGRLRIGPAFGWSRRRLDVIEIEDWRVAAAVAYRLGG